MDLVQLGNKIYLLAIDYFSQNRTSDTVITHVKSMFARHGIPEQVISDNGPQFSSEFFRLFAREYSFSHTTSSPDISSLMAEKGVWTVKDLLIKAIESGNDPYLALLSYRSSPLACGYSLSYLWEQKNSASGFPVYRTLYVVVVLMQIFKIALIAITIKVVRSLNP